MDRNFIKELTGAYGDVAKTAPKKWETEGDFYSWELSRYRCYAVRHPKWENWCAYIKLPGMHPWAGRQYPHGRLNWQSDTMPDLLRGKVKDNPHEDVLWVGMSFDDGNEFCPGLKGDKGKPENYVDIYQVKDMLGAYARIAKEAT